MPRAHHHSQLAEGASCWNARSAQYGLVDAQRLTDVDLGVIFGLAIAGFAALDAEPELRERRFDAARR